MVIVILKELYKSMARMDSTDLEVAVHEISFCVRNKNDLFYILKLSFWNSQHGAYTRWQHSYALWTLKLFGLLRKLFLILENTELAYLNDEYFKWKSILWLNSGLVKSLGFFRKFYIDFSDWLTDSEKLLFSWVTDWDNRIFDQKSESKKRIFSLNSRGNF